MFVNVPDSEPAVNSPAGVIVPPRATTAQVGVMTTGLPAMSAPVAVNCCVAAIVIVAGVGVTLMTGITPAVTTTVAVAESVPLVAFSVFV